MTQPGENDRAPWSAGTAQVRSERPETPPWAPPPPRLPTPPPPPSASYGERSSYYEPHAHHPQHPPYHRPVRLQRAWFAGGLAAAAAVLVAIAALVFVRPDPGPPTPAAAPVAPVAPVAEALTWDAVGAFPVPLHTAHGPRTVTAGIARGFSHDELGAAIAAIHISVRLSPDNSPQVTETVAREQCIGAVEEAIDAVAGLRATIAPGERFIPDETAPDSYWYEITGGDARGNAVMVSLVMATREAQNLGGYVRMNRIMVWDDGDWKMDLPVGAPELVTSVEGYELLGSPDIGP